MSKPEVDEYSEPFGEQVVPHPTGQFFGDYFPQIDLSTTEPRKGRALNLIDVPIQSISALRNLLLENKKRLLQVSAVSVGIVGGVTAGALIWREQRKPSA